MDYNLQNGGLIIKIDENLIISDMKDYSTAFKTQTSGLFWFMNFDGSSIFYSDQKRHNALCKMDTDSQKEEVVLQKPCYGLIAYKDWLYYINENDRMIYRCLKKGESETKLVSEPVGHFIFYEEQILYTTPQGIKICNEMGSERESVCNDVASSLMLIDNKLVFTDKNKQNTVNILDLNTYSKKNVAGMASSSMNTDGRYVYCANRLSDNSIYRVDIDSGSSIRICGESAEYLHVFDNELYFCNHRVWHKISLVGGQSEKIMR